MISCYLRLLLDATLFLVNANEFLQTCHVRDRPGYMSEVGVLAEDARCRVTFAVTRSGNVRAI